MSSSHTVTSNTELHLKFFDQKAAGSFPDDTVGRNPPATAQDMGSIPGLGDSTCHGVTKLVCHDY